MNHIFAVRAGLLFSGVAMCYEWKRQMDRKFSVTPDGRFREGGGRSIPVTMPEGCSSRRCPIGRGA